MKTIKSIIESYCKLFKQEKLYKECDWLNIDSFIEEFDNYSRYIRDNETINSEKSLEKNEFYYDFLSLININLCNLFLNVTDFLKMPGLSEKKRLQLRYLSFILSICVNDILAIIKLTKIGFEVQARIIIRHFMELLDIAICLIGDPNFIHRYKEEIKVNDKEIKFKSIAQGSIKKSANKIIKKTVKEYYKSDYDKMLFDLKEEYYTNFSEDVHGNITSTVFEAFSQPIDSEEEKLNPTIFGLVTVKNSSIIKNTISYLMAISPIILTLLASEQKVEMKELGGNGLKYIFLNEINMALFKEVLIKGELMKEIE